LTYTKTLDTLLSLGFVPGKDYPVISPANPWWMKISDTVNNIAFFDLCATIAITSVSAWAVGMRMRRRVKIDLGKTVGDGDLLSIQTWMRVDEIEKKKNPCRDWTPESTFVDRQMSKGARTLIDVLLRHLKPIEPESPTRKAQRWSIRG
jgi:hypothetical protein